MNNRPNAIGRRDPSLVMRLERLGSLHQCRLSFMRQLTRRMAKEGWEFSTPVFDINQAGVGHAVYCACGPEHTYSLVAFAHDLPDEQRSDRVIAEAWDATFVLFDGVPDHDDISRLSKNVPLQEAGRISERELSLSRANRSVRLWRHVVDRLAGGLQPDHEMIDQVGYLMRTTAVYGSGKFGACDREAIADREELHSPFQVEMLSVYLTRAFVRDLVQHCAEAKGGDCCVKMDTDIARALGIGNSTGLGMAPYLVNHPVLLNNWIMAREEAIARVRSLGSAEASDVELFSSMIQRCRLMVKGWRSEHPLQLEKLEALKKDLGKATAFLAATDLSNLDEPWNHLANWCEANLSVEGQELVASVMLEPYGELVDGLSHCMSDDNDKAGIIDGSMTIETVRDLLEQSFGWALELDWQAKNNCARAWYVSEEKLEPRLGERFDENIEAYEQPLAPARDAAVAYHAMAGWDTQKPVAEFLLRHSEHRHTVRRAQMRLIAPYGEIHDNTISKDMLPIDMLRAKLSFFGATDFDPRSDRWVRICMYGSAPYPEELSPENCDLWVYPEEAS